MPPHPGSRVIKTQFLLWLLFVWGEIHCTKRRQAVKSLLYLHRDLNSRWTITDSGHELINNEISFIFMRFTVFTNLIYKTTSGTFILKIVFIAERLKDRLLFEIFQTTAISKRFIGSTSSLSSNKSLDRKRLETNKSAEIWLD